MNLVGKPSQVGGSVTRFAGWSALAITALTATVLGLLANLLFSATAALVVAAVVALFGGGFALALLRGGRALRDRSETAQRAVRENALYALAARRGGQVSAADAAAALNIQLAEADALLTAMAREGGRVGVEIDANGTVLYVFRGVASAAAVGVPVGAAAGQSTGVRVAPEVTADDPSAPVDADQIRADVDREFARLQSRGKRE
jgi:hypothetical protein